MASALRLIAGIMNEIHDLLVQLSDLAGLDASDKDLHFWVIGLLGMAIFFATDVLFRRLVRWSVSAISLVYTFTVLIVFVFALEIQQKITGRGTMSFSDITAGLWGFAGAFTLYLILRLFYQFGVRLLRGRGEKKKGAVL